MANNTDLVFELKSRIGELLEWVEQHGTLIEGERWYQPGIFLTTQDLYIVTDDTEFAQVVYAYVVERDGSITFLDRDMKRLDPPDDLHLVPTKLEWAHKAPSRVG